MNEMFNIEKLFNEYKNKVYGLALSISKNPKDAEDILQNTFLQIIKNLKNFRKESKISTWIYKIAYNEAMMLFRKRRRPLNLSESAMFVNWSKLADEQLLESEFKERLELAIKRLPLKYRMPLLLHALENFSLENSAKVLRVTRGSVKTRLHRAYMKLRTELIDYLQDHKKMDIPQSKTCKMQLNFVYDYAAGNLGAQKEKVFHKHIDDCQDCKIFLNIYTQAINITHALQCQDLPPALEKKIASFLFQKKL